MKRYAELTWIVNVRSRDKKLYDNKLDYRNEWGVILCNMGDKCFHIAQGDRIAQGVLNKVEQINWVEVDNLNTTDRNGGFGSTGK